VDGWVFRVAMSEPFRAPPHEVRRWPLTDLVAAHAALDALDAERRFRDAKAAAEAARKGGR
jgi:hypothetical protein